jgi:two-component system, NtrC family, response regulator AtoC
MTDEPRLRFLIVDSEETTRQLCLAVGYELGFLCAAAGTAEEAGRMTQAMLPDLVVTGGNLGALSETDLVQTMKRISPRAEIGIMIGHGSVESAVDAVGKGAYDYIEKPLRAERLRQLLQRMAEKVRLVAENNFLRERVETENRLGGIVGSSSKIQEALRMVSWLKDSLATVLIVGESGTGKELVARAVHFRGRLAQMPFVAVDCGALASLPMNGGLFGPETSAPAGALKSKTDSIHAANSGTIFLNEIAEMPLELQANLLRMIEDREVRPSGSNDAKAPPRVIVATNCDLESACRAGRCRKDLYSRLTEATIRLPGLRERKSDIPQLVLHFLDRHAGGKNFHVMPAAMNRLLQYDWPGNVRELESCIARAVALGHDHVIDVDDLPVPIRGEQNSVLVSQSEVSSSTTALADVERVTIKRVFEHAGGDKVLARKLLGISRATLYRKLKRYNIPLRSSERRSAQTTH